MSAFRSLLGRLWIPITLLIAGGVIFALWYANRPASPTYRFATVERGDVVAAVAVVGNVIPSEEYRLAFPRSGTLSRVAVEVGETVASGTVLATLRTTGLLTDRAAAEARLRLADARLAQKFAGLSREEISVSETDAANAALAAARAASQRDEASIAATNAVLDLANAEAKSAQDLAKTYADALESAKGAQTTNDTALRTYKDMREKYLNGSTFLANQVKDNETAMRASFASADVAVQSAVQSPTHGAINNALLALHASLSVARTGFAVLRNAMDDPGVASSAADRSTVDTERASVDAGLVSVTAARTDITTGEASATKIVDAARASSDAARASFAVAEDVLREAEGARTRAERELAVAESAPREVDLALIRAEIDEARAALAAVTSELEDATLRAPVDGVVTVADGETGEQVTAGQVIVGLIPKDLYEIQADVSEAEIARLATGDPVRTTFDAFGVDRAFTGTLSRIDPVEKEKDGDIYYTATVRLDRTDAPIRPGMTADLAIETDRRDDTLYVARRAVLKDGDRAYVRLLENGHLIERGVRTGLAGRENTEILSGVLEGAQVVLSVRTP